MLCGQHKRGASYRLEAPPSRRHRNEPLRVSRSQYVGNQVGGLARQGEGKFVVAAEVIVGSMAETLGCAVVRRTSSPPVASSRIRLR
ncbi:MAG: hypothetical protein KatS3mg077_1183 [Candidatus Binatia bacterium]|nr:MAG: hypothetical protein KatS3mg077_1183 [Candidatus Binatia bacterium]